MSDEDLKLILQRAAEDDAFREALLDDRDKTVEQLDLAPHEKAMLKSVRRKQLESMIIRAMSPGRRGLNTAAKVVVGLGITAAAAAILLPATTGVARDTAYEAIAADYLRQVAFAQQEYKAEYGQYATLEALRNLEGTELLLEEVLAEDHPYEFTITTDGETFTATARHKTRPNTRRAFTVGPDSEVKELSDDASGR